MRNYNIFGEVGTQIPENAVEQMDMAMSIPPAIRGALMPDAHYGYSVPIGAVVALDNAISPAFIGYDISCMVHMTVLDIPVGNFLGARDHFAEVLRRVTRFGLGARFIPELARDHEVMDSGFWELVDEVGQQRPPYKSGRARENLVDTAKAQLGTSGGGNHFADLMVGQTENGDEFVCLLTHSGSRGVGHQICTHYSMIADEIRPDGIAKGYGWLGLDSQYGQEYHTLMTLMGAYATANHELMHKAFSGVAGVETLSTFSNRHNFAWVNEDGLVVHRKGATPAGSGVLGIIPGSSGSRSYLVSGLGNPESLESCAHGAGRPHSRSQAKKRHDPDQFDALMAEGDVKHIGVAPDETMYAYKDIENVIRIQEDAGLLETFAWMEPKVVIMGGKT